MAGSALLWKETIAGAVAREIERAELDPRTLTGIAYKAAWDRAGSTYWNHICAAEVDARYMRNRVFNRDLLHMFERHGFTLAA